MMISRVFLSYDAIDKNFAIQLMTDLRETGVEVIADHTDLEDMAFNVFLAEKLPQCQVLIVVQTPAALQSSRVQAAVDAALQHAQADQMIEILRVSASLLDAMVSQPLPPTWSTTPLFDASRDYPRALARLCLHLDLARFNSHFKAPLPDLQNMRRTALPVEAQEKQEISLPVEVQEQQENHKPPMDSQPHASWLLDTTTRTSEQQGDHKPSVASPPLSEQLDIQSSPSEQGYKNAPPVASSQPDLQQLYTQPGSYDQKRGNKLPAGRSPFASWLDAKAPSPGLGRGNNLPLSGLSRPQRLDAKANRNDLSSGNRPPVVSPPRAQRLDTKDRPRRPLRYPRPTIRRLRLIMVSVAIILIVVSLGSFLISHFFAPTRVPATSVVAVPTPTLAPTPTPTLVPTQIPTPPVEAQPSPTPVPFADGTWVGEKTFVSGQHGFDMTLIITVNGNMFSGKLSENSGKTLFVVYGTINASTANGNDISFSDTLTLSGGGDGCSGCIYKATVVNGQMSGTWFLPGSAQPTGTFRLNQQR